MQTGYNALGIDLSTAFRIFMERTKEVRGFPFSTPARKITHAEALMAFDELREQARNVPEMSLDEINESRKEGALMPYPVREFIVSHFFCSLPSSPQK